ncbi:hypothetical protein WEI85_25490 [Actinomycetes bacterium KLBMP 9797]
MKPLYARALRLRHTTPSGLLCFAYFEGAVILAVLLAFAERVSWWAVPILPALIAAWVKFYDVVAGVAERRREVRQAREAGATAGRSAVARHYAQAGPGAAQTGPGAAQAGPGTPAVREPVPPNAHPTDHARADGDALRARQSASRRYPPFS